MLVRGNRLYRFAISAAEKKRIQTNIENDRRNVYKTFQFQNARKARDNFGMHMSSPLYVQQSEVETRILKVIYDSQLFDIKGYKFSQDLRSDIKLDSLNIVVLLTSIEHEFTTVFEDRVFESVRNLEEIVHLLIKDEKVI